MKILKFLQFSKKKKIILAAVIVCAILGFYFFGRPKQEVLQFTNVQRADIKTTVSSSGTLTGKQSIDLRFKSSGKLSFMNVKRGDHVTVNQAIAELDTKLLEIDLQQAQNTLRDKQAAVEKIEDDVKGNSNGESFTQKSIRTTYQVTRDNAYDSVKSAQKALSDAEVFTPIVGVVTQAQFIPGQNVSSLDTIAQIVDFSEIYFDTDIDETDISKISIGQKVEITLDAYPDKIFEGKVLEIAPQTRTTSSGSTVVQVKINLGKPDLIAVNGLSGQSSIILADAKNVLVLPLESVRDDNTVFIQEAGGINLRKVEVGIKSDTDIEIKSGLNEADTVLLNPPLEGNTISQNRNPFQTVIFRVFGGKGSGGGSKGGSLTR